jgi:hypothetical protein
VARQQFGANGCENLKSELVNSCFYLNLSSNDNAFPFHDLYPPAITDSIEQNAFCEASGSSRHLWPSIRMQKVHYQVHMSPLMLSILNEMNPAHNIPTSFLNLLLLETPKLSLARVIFSGFDSRNLEECRELKIDFSTM